MGLRGNAIATAVPRRMRSVAVAANASGMNGSFWISGAITPPKPSASARRAASGTARQSSSGIEVSISMCVASSGESVSAARPVAQERVRSERVELLGGPGLFAAHRATATLLSPTRAPPRARRMPRTAWRVRCSFSINENRT